jgi:glutamine amidotransferase-like uncharacterized protein
VLERERRPDNKAARVGVFADAGVWHPGARAIVAALEAEGVPCRVLDRSLLTRETLAGLEAVVLPGGWAPHQWAAAADKGLGALKAYVEGGGRCLGVCAGAYLIARTVEYDGKEYTYPLGLFDGVAAGPVPGLAVFPAVGVAKLSVTTDGKDRGLGELDETEAYYSGGPSFRGGTNTRVMATYSGGSAVAVRRAVAKGEVVLLGVHLERPTGKDVKDDDPPPRTCGRVLVKLLRLDTAR